MLSFDGHDLETLFVCGDPEISILNYEPRLETFDSRDGAAMLGGRWDVSTVAFSIGVRGTALERRNAFSQLGAWLDVDDPKQLILPDTPDRYYLAVPNGSVDLRRGILGEIAQLSFTLTDPIAYGIEEKYASVPYGGSVTFNVGGTAPTFPYFDKTLERPDQTTKQWGLRLDSHDVFILDFGTTVNRTIKADFGERVSYVNDVIKLPTINSDWFALTPGEHTVENHIGSGNGLRLRWHERWY